jgi:hypothetical protein
MRVLVATDRTQGSVDGDYCWTVEGELVLGGPLLECASPDRCGCGRGFPGLASCRATTTAMVVDRPHIGRAELGQAILDYLERHGWLQEMEQHEIEEGLEDEIALIEAVTAAFPDGAIVGRQGNEVVMRAWLVA